MSIDNVKWFWNAATRMYNRKGEYKLNHRSWEQFDRMFKIYDKSIKKGSITTMIISCMGLLLWILFI